MSCSQPPLQGESWDVWLSKISAKSDGRKDPEPSSEKRNHRNFATLPHAKAPCYGSVPIQDDFLLVQCELCTLRVKPLSYVHHMNTRHSGALSPVSVSSLSLRSPESSSTHGILDSFLLSPAMQSICTTGEGSPPHADVPLDSKSGVFDEYPLLAQNSSAKNSGSRSTSSTPSSVKKSTKKSKSRPPTAKKSVNTSTKVQSDSTRTDADSTTDYKIISGAGTSKEGALKLKISKKFASGQTSDSASSAKSVASTTAPTLGANSKAQTSSASSAVKNTDRQNKRKQQHFVSPAKSEVKIVGIKSEPSLFDPIVTSTSSATSQQSTSNDAPPTLVRQTASVSQKGVDRSIRPKLELLDPHVKKEAPVLDANSNSWDLWSMEHPKPVQVCQYGATKHSRIVDGKQSFFYTFARVGRNVDSFRLQFQMAIDPQKTQKSIPQFLPTYECDSKPAISKRRARKMMNKAHSPGLDSLPDLQLAISSVSSSSPILKEDPPDEVNSPLSLKPEIKPESRTSNLRRLLQDPRSQAIRPMKRPAVLPRMTSINADKIAQQPSSHFPTINLNRVAQMQKSSTGNSAPPQAVRLSDITDNRNALAYASQPPPLVQMQPYPSHISSVPTCHISPVSSSSHTYAKSPTQHYNATSTQQQQHTNNNNRNLNNYTTSNRGAYPPNQDVIYIDGSHNNQPEAKRFPAKRPIVGGGVGKLKRRKSSMAGPNTTHVPSNTGYVIEQTPFMPQSSVSQGGSWQKLARPPTTTMSPVPCSPSSTSTTMPTAMILDAHTGKIYPISHCPPNGTSPHAMSMTKSPNGLMIRKGNNGNLGQDPNAQMVLKGACVSESQYPYLSPGPPLVRLSAPADYADRHRTDARQNPDIHRQAAMIRPMTVGHPPAGANADPRNGPPTLQPYPRAPHVVRH